MWLGNSGDRTADEGDALGSPVGWGDPERCGETEPPGGDPEEGMIQGGVHGERGVGVGGPAAEIPAAHGGLAAWLGGRAAGTEAGDAGFGCGISGMEQWYEVRDTRRIGSAGAAGCGFSVATDRVETE